MQMDNSYMITYSTPLIIREMQIKTRMSSPFTPVRMAIIKKNTNVDSVGEGEGGKIWENGIETCTISYMK